MRRAVSAMIIAAASWIAMSQPSEASDTMSIKITKIRPQPPLDPYRPFEVHFEIANNGSGTLEIADIKALEIRVTDLAGSPVMARKLRHPKTFGNLRDDLRRKYREIADPVVVKPRTTYEGVLKTLDAVAPLASDAVLLRLRVQDRSGNTLESDPFRANVKALAATRSTSARLGRSFKNTTLSQAVHEFRAFWGRRWVFVSSLYPDFDSVVFDGPPPAGADAAGLPLYWPPNALRLQLFAHVGNSVLIYEVANPPPYDISDTLKQVRSIPVPEGAEVWGLVQVTADERGAGADDYLTIASGPPLDGSRELLVEYWRRDWERTVWNRQVVMRREVRDTATPVSVVLGPSGITVHASGDKAIDIDLAAGLEAFRKRALESGLPPASLIPSR